MKVQHLFATGIGIAYEPELLKVAEKIFSENQTDFLAAPNVKNFRTTLKKHLPAKSNLPSYANEKDIDCIKDVIKKHSLSFLEKSGYDITTVELEVSGLWLNEMQSGSFHAKHHHYGYSLSGCYYVSIPPNSAKISFFKDENINSCKILNVNQYTALNSGNWDFYPENGDLFIWQSTLRHEVPSVEFDGIRKSIAFDVLITHI